MLLDPLNFDQTIDVPWRVTLNSSQWQPVVQNMTRFLGHTLTVYFNDLRNAGDGTAHQHVFLDQVQVVVCDTVASHALGSGQRLTALAQAPVAAPMAAQPMPATQNTVITVNGGSAPFPKSPWADGHADNDARFPRESRFADRSQQRVEQPLADHLRDQCAHSPVRGGGYSTTSGAEA